MSDSPRTINPADLPETITSYLKAHHARDLDVAVRSYASSATVTDEGRTYRGPEAIRAWLARSAIEFTYRIEIVGARKLDENR